MKKIILIAILYFVSINSFAQSEAANWYFGYGAGIKFNQTNNTISSLNDGQLFTNEGSATISDSSGDLLFYTDGTTVWNKNHAIMSNGNSLFGDSSSTQSAIIVPKPNDPDIYYIFTVDNALDGFNYGLNYSEVDITLNGGLGAVTNKNIQLLKECSEKITAVIKDCVTKSIWVLTFASPDGSPGFFNTFHAFEVSDTGVNTTSVTSTFSSINVSDARGYLKLSPDGVKIACANAVNGLLLFDFDAATGIVSNEQHLNINSQSNIPYGVEFSPNSQLLYVHSSNNFFDQNNPSNNNIPSNHASTLTQFDVTALNIQNTEYTIDQRLLYRGGLQLGPDGKIYRALSATYDQGLPNLGVINNPNSIGAASNYQHNAVNISPNNSSQGLPPFITSFFAQKIDIIRNSASSSTFLPLCIGDTYKLIADDISGAIYSWTRDGIPLAENDFDLVVSQEGVYEVLIDPNTGDCEALLEGIATVTYSPNPVAFNATLVQCDEDGILGGFTRFNLNESYDALTNGAPNLSVKFYRDIARTNEIINSNSYNYDVDSPHLIYTKIINNTTSCFDTSELTLDVSTTKINNFPATPLCDELGSEDGINTFNLDDIRTEIQSFNNLTFPITFFKTYEEALLEENNLGNLFINTIPYSQTIYVRIENNNNCYGISEVQLTVNKLPNIKIEDFAYYCINKYPETITINASVIDNLPNNYTYLWSTGEDTYQINVNEAKTYTVTVTNKLTNCSKEKTVIVEPSNMASFNFPEPYKIVDATQNNTVTIFISGEGIYEYRLLDENNTVYAPYQESNTFQNVAPGMYTISVKDIKNNCGTTPPLNISVIGFPKFFTPNGDGYNDTWQVSGVSGVFQPNSIIYIFDRFGKLIKQLSPFEVGWNGLVNGEKLPTDDYWFAVKLQDGRVFKNHFTLKY